MSDRDLPLHGRTCLRDSLAASHNIAGQSRVERLPTFAVPELGSEPVRTVILVPAGMLCQLLRSKLPEVQSPISVRVQTWVFRRSPG